MWILILILLLFAAHFNLTALVPLQVGAAPPPWWVGGMLIWPFSLETRTLLPPGDLLNTITPLLSIAATICFLLATAALLGRLVPARWFRRLIAAGVVFSIPLQIIWFSAWAILPLLVDAALLWAVFGRQITVANLRRPEAGHSPAWDKR
jgi:hypothetical protein